MVLSDRLEVIFNLIILAMKFRSELESEEKIPFFKLAATLSLLSTRKDELFREPPYTRSVLPVPYPQGRDTVV
jgi:hypothetical protein